ncbi:beta-glucosidase 24-like isoform X2 [Arachis duranensis]|uniref:Beta-glucosidase 24-like isoform X2 n=1 Tax=Arachis duranensis TaxID=130453 RepID=A0A9C6WN84_ARADU|nr:beta-glucosidase 24-like isoform X2 [Arachis duranensis]
MAIPWSNISIVYFLVISVLNILLLHYSAVTGETFEYYYDTASLKRSSFPEDFIFGTSSSSYQYEGAVNEGGKGPSIWDTFTKKYPNKIKDESSGEIAVDSYHRFKEDVQIMKELRFDAYRFSISWSRILPGLTPFITLFQYDYPQSLEDAYGGFLSPQIVKDFTDYAEVCFKAFGDRVKYWITFNGPSIFSKLGYTIGKYAPGRCSSWLNLNCTGGDSATEPYIVTHHQLLAHASAVKLFREKYQGTQMGQIGIIHGTDWVVPLSQSKEDIDATSRALSFLFDWFMEPLHSGSYPAIMIENVGERLPKFTEKESDMLINSFDFIGINYYSSVYAADIKCPTQNKTYLTDSFERNGIPIGPRAASDWIYLYPQGIEELLMYIKIKYNNPIIYVTENGYDNFSDENQSLKDQTRIDCYVQHLSHVHNAIRNGVDVRGYFIWSLLDNFEWCDGYTVQFGIVYVDFANGLKRYPKDSAKWFKNFLHQEYKSQ